MTHPKGKGVSDVLNCIDWSKCVICQKVRHGFVRHDLNAFQ